MTVAKKVRTFPDTRRGVKHGESEDANGDPGDGNTDVFGRGGAMQGGNKR